MKRTGSLLKEKREAAKLSLSEVALATKINPKILTAIEEGDEARLPAKTFLRGFVKSYAQYLRMDVDEVLKMYQEEVGASTPVVRITMPPPQQSAPQETTAAPAPASARAPANEKPKSGRRRMDDQNSSGMRTAAVIVIVFLIGLIIGVRELIEKYQREKNIEGAQNIKVSPLIPAPGEQAGPDTAKPADSEKPADQKPDETKPTAGQSAADQSAATKPAADAKTDESKPAEATRPAETKPKAKKEKVAATAAPLPDFMKTPPTPLVKTESATDKPTEAGAETATPTAEPNTDKSGDAAPQSAKVGKNEIILEALDKVDVKFELKGETKTVSLGPTQVHTILSDQPVTLDLSDGGAVNIILNGHDQGPPGELGKPKQIRIP